MSQVKSGNTKPETVVRKLIWKKGYRYRIGHGLPGKPDMVLPSHRIAVFIDGCFWHGCPWHCRMPSSNIKYWRKKISGNKERDKTINKRLKKNGWKVIRVWEHNIKKNSETTANEIIKKILS